MMVPVPVIVSTCFGILGMLIAFWWMRTAADRYRSALRSEIFVHYNEIEFYSRCLLGMHKSYWLRVFMPEITSKIIRKEPKESLYYRYKSCIESQRKTALTKHGLEI